MKNYVIRTRNGNSNLKQINKITKTRCSLKKNKGLHSDSGFILWIKCLLTLSNNGVMSLYLFWFLNDNKYFCKKANFVSTKN